VSIASPEDGTTVGSPFQVKMEADGFAIEPAGEVREGAGHLHLMVDADCLAPGETIPEDEAHLHFGDGSTETELDLPAGQHSLCLQAGDGAHTALDLTDQITITVMETVVGPGEASPDGEVLEPTGEEEWEGILTGIAQNTRSPCNVRYEGDYTIEVTRNGTATLEGSVTATTGGGCAPSTTTSPIGARGQRTASGFLFPDLFATDTVIDVSGSHGTGTSMGESPDATWEYEFEINCVLRENTTCPV
jgi:Domain of unknown function (DUF4399)